MISVSKFSAMLLASALAVPANAANEGGKRHVDHVNKDAEAHRTIAQAHETVATCLESGKPEQECHAQLAKDCQGIAIGRFYGMKHRH